MKWFKHDANASIDAKLQRVRLKYGMEGYGLYWFLLESIARNVESHNLTFELEEDAELISATTGIHYERVQEMMAYMVDLGLFENVSGVVTCIKMATRSDEYTQKLLKNINGLPTKSRQSPDTLGTKSENVRSIRREEKRIENKGGRFTPPSLIQVTDYCKERGNNIDPQSFLDHYEANGWMRGKNKIKDWKACVRTWERSSRPEAKPEAGGYY